MNGERGTRNAEDGLRNAESVVNSEFGTRNSEWMTVRLGDVVEINPRGHDGTLMDETVVSFVPMASVCEEKKQIREAEDRVFSEVKKGYTPMKRGDVIVAKITPCFENGKMAMVDVKNEFAYGSTEFHVFRASGTVDSRLIYHLLRSQQIITQGRSKMKGAAGQKRVPAEFFRAFEFRVPRSLAAQRRIAGILDAADRLRAQRRETLAQLDTLLQSTFLELFGDPVTNPKGWEQKTLGELLKVKSGDGLVAKDMTPDGKFPVYGGNGINGYHDAYMFEEPKIVLGRVGAYCGAVHMTKPKSWVTDNALYVREIFQEINITYLLAALKLADLNQYAGRAAQPLISGSRIYPVPILTPPLDLQRRFAAIVETVEKQKARQRAHLAELDALFASLQSRAFNGEL